MSRALKFTLLVGVQIAWVLTALYALDATARPDAALARALGLEAGGNLRGLAWLEYLSILALAFGVLWTSLDLPRPGLKVLVAAVGAALTFTLTGTLALHGGYFSPWLPAVAAGLALVAGWFYGRTPRGRRRRLVQRVFEGRVSPTVARALHDGRTPLDAAERGASEELSVVVCEVFNHEALLDVLPPSEALARVNAALLTAAEVLVGAGGCLAACGGEGVRAVFGAPLPGSGQHAAAACRGALEAVRRVRALHAAWTPPRATSDGEEIHGNPNGHAPGCDLRIGINSGEMIAGRFGAPGRRLAGYDVSGEEAAFARRLCGVNLLYGSTVLLGARTYELAEGFVEARPLELLRRRGGEDCREVYELLGESQDLSPEDLARRNLFWTGVILYREKRLDEAWEKFSQARALAPLPDGPLEFYLHRIEGRQPPTHDLPADGEAARLLNAP